MLLGHGVGGGMYRLTAMKGYGDEGHIDGSCNADARPDLNLALDTWLLEVSKGCMYRR